jgi:RNA polymerase sigma-70 factor (ECF subfamily)
MSTREQEAVAAVQGGDETAFGGLVEPHRHELQVHCYRMLGSFEDSEDLVQETFLRAWRKRETFAGRSTFRAWLYRIATNACLDALARRPRTPSPSGEVLWLQPYPDHLLEEIAAPEDEPGEAVAAKETIELAFMVAIQHLPPQQRAVLILRDVLSWSAKDAAALLETSVASVNSALQRARAAMKQHLPERRLEWAPGEDPSERERELLERYMDASDRVDMPALTALLHEDLRFSMPPQPGLYVGREEVVGYWLQGGIDTPEFGELRSVLTRANRQPAVAFYNRSPGESRFEPMAIDVLAIEEGTIVEIITFGPDVFPSFGLPETL